MDLQPLQPNSEGLRIIEPLCAVFRRKLKAEGLKYTPERARLLDVIAGIDGLFQADQILETVRAGDGGAKVSKATIYRTIKLLLEAGIIQRVPFDDEQAHYQLVYAHKPHDLLIRVDTQEAIPIEVPELIEIRNRICRERGLDPQGHRFQIFATGEGS